VGDAFKRRKEEKKKMEDVCASLEGQLRDMEKMTREQAEANSAQRGMLAISKHNVEKQRYIV
jgi:hypothetical protein